MFQFGYHPTDNTYLQASASNLPSVGVETEMVYTFDLSKAVDGEVAVYVGMNLTGTLSKVREKRADSLYMYRGQINNTYYIGVAVKKVWLE